VIKLLYINLWLLYMDSNLR